MSTMERLIGRLLDGSEAIQATTFAARIITFSKNALIYEDWEDDEASKQAKVHASIQVVTEQMQHPPSPSTTNEDQNDFKMLCLNTLEDPIYVSFGRDTFFFADDEAFQVFFDCVSNPLEYPVRNRVGVSGMFKKIRHLAIGGITLPPVLLETLLRFEGLQSLRLDSRIIIPTNPVVREKTEKDFATWYQAQLRERGYVVPLIEWIWDLGYWFNRRTKLGEGVWDDQTDDARVFEQGGTRAVVTSFMAQCLKPGTRRFVPSDRQDYQQTPWLPAGDYRR